MENVTPEWMDLLKWMCDEASYPDPPKCPPIAVKGWFESTTRSEREASDSALMHWLVTWEWPEMSLDVQGLVHLRLSFALYGILQAMAQGRELPRGDAQKRGVIHGLVFRNWQREQDAWLGYYAVQWPSLRTIANGQEN